MKYYLDKNQIERLASNKDVYAAGSRLFAQRRVNNLSFYDAAQKTLVVAKVTDDGNEHTVSVTFDESGILHKYGCTCNASGIWRGACEHAVASFLKIFEHSRESALLSKTLRASRSLLNTFEKRAMAEIDESLGGEPLPASPVSLEPIFNTGHDGEALISIEAGIKRMYVIRNVFAFLDAVKKGETVAYGKNLEFNHAISSFDKKSRELIKLLSNENDILEKTGRVLAGYSYNYAQFGFHAFQNGRSVPLTAAGLDKFYMLYAGSSLKSSIPACTRTGVLLSDEKPQIRFTAGHNGDPSEQFADTLTAETQFEPMFMKGESYGYVLCGNILHKIEPAFYNALHPIFSCIKATGSKTLYFPRSDSARFNAFLLPALRAYGVLEGMEDAPAELPEPVKKVYLDADGGIVTCRAVFCYGEQEVYYPDGNANSVSDFVRNIPEEYRLVKNLSLMGFSHEMGEKRYTLAGDDGIYGFYYSENGLSRLRELAEVYATDAFLQVSGKSAKAPAFGLRLKGNLLEVSVEKGDFSASELMDVLSSYRLNKKYHKLSDGRFVNLTEGTNGSPSALEMLDALVSGIGVSEKEIAKGRFNIPKYRALYAGTVLSENAEADSPAIDEGVKALLDDFRSYKTLDFAIPDSMGNVLREYQKEGFRWLKTLDRYGFGGILADDMGLGKTIQVISLLLSYKQETPEIERKSSIVVAPTSLIYNWEKEIMRFAPELTTVMLSGPAAKRKETLDTAASADVYITTYDMLKRDVENYSGAEFRYVVADEAQNIKNPGTQNAKAVKTLKADVRLALTGTPIENSLSELWSIFDFIMPGYLFGMTRFTKQYETPILKNNDKQAAAALKRQISPFILRRLKSDVLTELPEKVETTLYADMPDEQKKIYTAYLLKAKGELEETVKLGKYGEKQIEILSMLTRLRQICCHPGTFLDDYAGGSGKLDLTVETVKMSLESGHRALIFSQFTKMLTILREYLDRENISYFYLDGATPSKERLEMADAFNSGEKEAFLISLKAGGAGLNLTGADVVIHYDPWWNPAVMSQAADRAHRFGQMRTVQVINIVAKDSIEEKIIALQARKKDLVDAVIEEGANFITKLSQDEIMQLFSAGK